MNIDQSGTLAEGSPSAKTTRQWSLAEAHVPDKVAEALSEYDGFWSSCSGCFEAGEYGGLEHLYPHSPVFECRLGSGCGECGGIGAIWDNTDYDAMAREMLADDDRRGGDGEPS
jgi:hypothetical protein